MRLLGFHPTIGPRTRFLLALLPFVTMIVVYWIASDIRHAHNPNDKLLPGFDQMFDAIWRMATVPDVRSGKLLLWADTVASLKRLAVGVVSGALVGLILGLNIGLFPGFRAMTRTFVTFLSIVPPLTVLPILFIVFGTGEEAKIILIFIGTVFVITRDIILATMAIPLEQIIRALTLGASELAVTYRIVMPQILPRLINTTRLTLGAAWLFLIAAEMISATEGLGYRIGLVRRYLAMDIIIPYVIWITLLGLFMDIILRLILTRAYAWYEQEG